MAEWRGVSYNSSDMLRMQQEAIRRVRQMQQRARQSIEGQAPPGKAAGSPSALPWESASAASDRRIPGGAAPRRTSGGIGERLGDLLSGSAPHRDGGSIIRELLGGNSPAVRVLDALNIDNERMILIGLLLVLAGEETDHTLLIALVYLLL